MKAIYFILILMILLPFTSLAKEIKNNRYDVRNYKTELSLTQQQMNQLNVVYSNMQAQSKLTSPNLTLAQRKSMRIERRKQYVADLSTILTKDQRLKLKGIIQPNKVK